MDYTIAEFSKGLQEYPQPVRMLLFNDAVHLYDAESNHFIAAFLYRDIRLLQRDPEWIRFSLSPYEKTELRVPARHVQANELVHATDGKSVRRKKRLNRFALPLALVGMAALAAALYYLLIAGVAGLGMKVISTEKESELGEMIYSSMMKGMPVDTAASRHLTAFAEQLRLSGDYRLHFAVVDQDEVNAFAIPGGYIVVYKGILKQMKEPTELVALLGHEVSHVNQRHSLRNMLQELTGGVILSLVLGDLGSVGGTLVANANRLRSLSYSRGLEEEADQKGMEKMIQNRVDPAGMVGLMDRLSESDKNPGMPGFLSTHPLTADRKAAAVAFISRHPVKFDTPASLLGPWTQLKSAVMAAPDSTQNGSKGDSNW